MTKRIKNIGILAHVDAGKTTITENFLFIADAIKSLGNVDQGSSVTDSMSLEKERGISIRSAGVSFTWEGVSINLIDTPGHTDFSSEVERALAVMDGVILVISAVEGVQSHTITLWEGIKRSKLPCLFFINKIDRPGADFRNGLYQIRKELMAPVFPLNFPADEGENTAKPVMLFERHTANSTHSPIREMALETLADEDEEILDLYLENKEISHELIQKKLILLSYNQQINPLYCGAAKFGRGMEDLLNGTIKMIPDAPAKSSADLGALVYKVEHDRSLGKIAHIRIFSGKIKSRDLILNYSRQVEEKVSQIKKKLTNKMTNMDELGTGDIGIISGMQSIRAGDILGNPDHVPKLTPLQDPVITVNVKANADKQYADLAKALFILNTEDPSLDFKWYKENREMHLHLMGTVQIEILESILGHRFGIKAVFSDPTVIYKETPAGMGEAWVEYTMPKPCWAVLRFRVEAGAENSGINYQSKVSVNNIHRKYQNEIAETIPPALEQGIKGWEVTDINITLLEGEDHEIHSRPGDFILATPMGIMRALEKSGTKLLEPVYKFDIRAPESYLGAITSDLIRMRGTFESPDFENDNVIIKGTLPVATSLKYNIRLSSLTGGKGRFRKQFGGNQACPDDQGKSRSYVGVNPLNTSQWILHKRGAFKAEGR